MAKIYKSIQMTLTDTSQFPKGKKIYYRCRICGDIISSVTKENIGCSCGNIFIDYDYFRLSIKSLKDAEVVEEE